jgi:hypothetical protein
MWIISSSYMRSFKGQPRCKTNFVKIKLAVKLDVMLVWCPNSPIVWRYLGSYMDFFHIHITLDANLYFPGESIVGACRNCYNRQSS